MAIYHLSAKIGSKAGGKSAVASAAYRAGEKLTRERDNTKKDYSRKQGVVYSEIMLPDHAPRKFADRETLWNDVEYTEKAADAQLYREFEIALPRELTRQQQIEAAREFCLELNKIGMITDINIHDKDDGNPHAHIMCPTRQLDQNGHWAAKRKSGYALDENGNKIPVIDPKTGQQKIEAKTGRKCWKRERGQKNPWDERGNVDVWREQWEQICNRALKHAGSSARIDRRSHKTRGIKFLPTRHEGPAARAISRRHGRSASPLTAQNDKIVALNTELKSISKETKLINFDKKQIATVATAPAEHVGNAISKIADGIINSSARARSCAGSEDNDLQGLTAYARRQKMLEHRFDDDEDEGQSLKGNVSYIAPEPETPKKEKRGGGEQRSERQPERELTNEETKTIERIKERQREAIEAQKAAKSGKLSKGELLRLDKRMDELLQENIKYLHEELLKIKSAAENDYIAKSPLKQKLDNLTITENFTRGEYDKAKNATNAAQKKYDELVKSEPKQNIFNKLLGESVEHKAWAKQSAAAKISLAGAQKTEAATAKNWLLANDATKAVRSQIDAGAKAAGKSASAAMTQDGVIGKGLSTPIGQAANIAYTAIETTITIIKAGLKVFDETNQVMAEVADKQQETARVRKL